MQDMQDMQGTQHQPPLPYLILLHIEVDVLQHRRLQPLQRPCLSALIVIGWGAAGRIAVLQHRCEQRHPLAHVVLEVLRQVLPV